MVCHPCKAAGNLSEAVCGRRVVGEVPTYRERLKVQVSYRECNELLVVGSLTSHLMTLHGRVAETQRQWSTPAAGAGPWTFRMTLPAKGRPRSCSVEGCPGRVATRTEMRVQFLHRHVLNIVVILEEGNLSHPRCARCNILVPRRALNGRYPAMSQCARVVERKRRRLVEAETRKSLKRAFKAYG